MKTLIMVTLLTVSLVAVAGAQTEKTLVHCEMGVCASDTNHNTTIVCGRTGCVEYDKTPAPVKPWKATKKSCTALQSQMDSEKTFADEVHTSWEPSDEEVQQTKACGVK